MDGVIYTTGSYSRMFAVDARTGRKLWEYDHSLPDGIMPCCDVINRGAAIYGDMVYFGTLDSKLVALDRKTGKVVWSKKVDNYQAGSSITSAPIIVHGHVIVTPAGGEFGVVGKVAAYDAKTGEEVWSRPFVEGWMGTFHGKESTMTGKQPLPLGPGICGRPVDRRLGTAARTIPIPTCFSAAPATLRRGILTIVLATICIRPLQSP